MIHKTFSPYITYIMYNDSYMIHKNFSPYISHICY